MSSNPSSSTEQHTECPACGYTDIVGHTQCPQCKVELYSQRISSKKTIILQVLLFGALLLFMGYPYIARNIPAVEKLFEPGAALRRQADQLFYKNKWKQAQKLYQTSLQKKGLLARIGTYNSQRQQSVTLYKMALCSLRLKQLDAAVGYAQKASKRTPKWILPHELILRVYIVQKKKNALLQRANIMKKHFSQRWQMWLALGNAYGQFALQKEAMAAFKKGLSLNPKSRHLLNNLAWEYLRKAKPKSKELKEAKKWALRAYQYGGKKDFIALDTLAKIAFLQGHLNTAIQKQKKALLFAKGIHANYKKEPSPRHSIQTLSRAIQSMQFRLAQMKALALRAKALRTQAHATTLPTSKPIVLKVTKRPKPQPSSTPKTLKTSKKNPPTARPTSMRAIPLPRSVHHRRSRKLLAPF